METEPRARDLRLAVVGASAWGGTLIGLSALGSPDRGRLTVGLLLLGCVLGVAAAGAVRAEPSHPGLPTPPLRAVLLLCLTTLVLLAGLAGLRSQATTSGALAELAQRRALVTVMARVTSDPVVRPGSFDDVLIYRVTVTRVDRPARAEVRSPLLVMADPGVSSPRWGSSVEVTGRLAPSDGRDLAGVLVAHQTRVVSGPATIHRAAERVRASIRRSSAGPSPGDRLVPALVDGDDADLPAAVVADFRSAGLTHLTAVSGANLTILLAVMIPAARWCRIRARGILVVSGVAVACFVLVARPEPSVLRAAVMGCVALIGLGAGGRGAGLRALGFAVLVLLLLSPQLATTWGFALSVAATAGILLLTPGLSHGLSAHLPRPVAEALAVPVAAQLACTPLVAALTDEVSLVAVLANLAAAPLVAPTTILGLGAGLLGMVWQPLAWVPGHLAGWCGYGIVVVAERSAGLPGASMPWAGEGWGLVALSLLCLAGAALARPLAQRRVVLVVLVAVLVAVLLLPGTRAGERLVPGGWPAAGWLVAMCDVGQGDALVLRSGPDSAVVVDAGPEPGAVDRCLDRLGVDLVTSLVLTHFHQDHVGGLPGVLDGRRVAEIQVSPFPSPPEGAASVREAAERAGVPLRTPQLGETASAGEVGWQVVGPVMPSGENPNDASLVLLAEVGGVRVLLTGDAEPLAQGRLAARWGITEVDVVKVPHHGSRHQDAAWLSGLDPEVALVSAGRDNDYGHPAPETLALLEQAGATVWRTDRDGDVALVPTPAGLGVSLG